MVKQKLFVIIYNGLQACAVRDLEAQNFLSTLNPVANEAQNFIEAPNRQFLVGAVSGSLFFVVSFHLRFSPNFSILSNHFFRKESSVFFIGPT